MYHSPDHLKNNLVIKHSPASITWLWYNTNLCFTPRNVHEWVNEPYSWNIGVFTTAYQGIAIGYQGVCGTMVKRLTEALIFKILSLEKVSIAIKSRKESSTCIDIQNSLNMHYEVEMHVLLLCKHFGR